MSIKLSELIQRDISSNINQQPKKYQIHASYLENKIKIANVEKKQNKDIYLSQYDIGGFKCTLISYTLSDDDLDNERFFMIGYLIKNKDEVTLATLNLIFKPINVTDPSNKMYLREPVGHFEIILSNIKNEHKVLRKFDKYIGNDKAIYLLTEVLTEVLANEI